jgi:hypothetical protein
MVRKLSLSRQRQQSARNLVMQAAIETVNAMPRPVQNFSIEDVAAAERALRAASAPMSPAVSSAYVQQRPARMPLSRWGNNAKEPPVKINPRPEQFPTEKWVYEGLTTGYKRGDLHCCGVKEIHGIQSRHMFRNRASEVYEYVDQSPIEMLREVQKLMNPLHLGRQRPFWVFTDATSMPQVGAALADFIRQHNLGTVLETTREHNPNSGNSVRVYLWTAPIDFNEFNLEKLNVGT